MSSTTTAAVTMGGGGSSAAPSSSTSSSGSSGAGAGTAASASASASAGTAPKSWVRTPPSVQLLQLLGVALLLVVSASWRSAVRRERAAWDGGAREGTVVVDDGSDAPRGDQRHPAAATLDEARFVSGGKGGSGNGRVLRRVFGA